MEQEADLEVQIRGWNEIKVVMGVNMMSASIIIWGEARWAGKPLLGV